MKTKAITRDYWITLLLIIFVFPVIFMVFYAAFKVFNYRKKKINETNWSESLKASHYIALSKNLLLYIVIISAATILASQGIINGMFLILIVIMTLVITIINMNRLYTGKVAL